MKLKAEYFLLVSEYLKVKGLWVLPIVKTFKSRGNAIEKLHKLFRRISYFNRLFTLWQYYIEIAPVQSI